MIYFIGWILDEFQLTWARKSQMGSFMDTWLDSPYTYDIYDTNDGYSMIVMTQLIYGGWNITYQVEIEHPIELSCDLEKPNGFLLNLGEDGRWRERPHGIAWAATSIQLGFGLWMYLEAKETINVYKIQGEAIRKRFLIICEIFSCEERRLVSD